MVSDDGETLLTVAPKPRWGRRSIWLLGLAFLIVVSTGLADSQLLPAEPDTWGVLAAAFCFVAVGGVILDNVPGHKVGWVLTSVGLAILLSGLVEALSQRGVILGGLGGALWFLWFYLAGFLMLWFPTGKTPSARWRWLEWLGYIGAAVLILAYTFTDSLCEPTESSTCEANPVGISWVPNPEYEADGAFLVPLVLFVLLSATSLVVRVLRARGVERQQLKWMALAASALILWVAATESIEPEGFEVIAGWVFAFLVLGIPIAVAMAILRYRLYEIDRIISRTVSYTVVVGFLGVVFAAGVVWIPSVLGLDDSPLLVAGSTLVVASLFNPVRGRVQNWVDRRFNRSRYDARRVMDSFAASLNERLEPKSVLDGWVDVVSEAMQPETVGVWVKE